MVKNEKFQCPSERGGPENFKNHPTFVPSAIFGGVMASQNMVNFFLGHPVVVRKSILLMIDVWPTMKVFDDLSWIYVAVIVYTDTAVLYDPAHDIWVSNIVILSC